ncbi:uncharacterized protein ARMOST_16196 [Armillaria ostoyae]|uniref:Chromo domain-containing protein n=1 Tax=Armillaria ostoyae TaxID=47428 RepID=A0A284RVM4_ARMOS|nr:uncharacterized protein ARMOST_16196 [Armillaria ostoyae]
MKTQYNKKKKATVEYQIRDKAWLNTTNLHLTCPKKKLNNKHISHFPILEKRCLSAYKLKLPAAWKIYPIFNETLLTPYTPPAFPNQEQPSLPPPDIIYREEQYEIKIILNDKPCKVCRRKGEPLKIVTDYLVKWKGYGSEENKWTAERELSNTKEAIADYLKTKKGAVTVQAIMVEPKTATVIIDT